MDPNEHKELQRAWDVWVKTPEMVYRLPNTTRHPEGRLVVEIIEHKLSKGPRRILAFVMSFLEKADINHPREYYIVDSSRFTDIRLPIAFIH